MNSKVRLWEDEQHDRINDKKCFKNFMETCLVTLHSSGSRCSLLSLEINETR